MHNRGPEYITGPVKRRLDLIGSLALSLSSLPIAAAAYAASAVDNHSFNPLFRQLRVGQAGQPLQITKFRTLRAELTAGSLQAFGAIDHRATATGQFLRRFALDELPQIAQVIDGSMSLVGMRPELPETIDKLAVIAPDIFPAWHAAYTASKPALTGPSQIYRRSEPTLTNAVFRQSMILDLAYFNQASLTGDIKTIVTTPLELGTAVSRSRTVAVQDPAVIPVSSLMPTVSQAE